MKIPSVYSRKWRYILPLILIAGMTAMFPSVLRGEPASDRYPNYSVIKGGYYYPSERISLDEFSGTDFDRKKGFNGEIAFGQHYGPVFGSEIGIGYFETRRFPGVGQGRATIEAVPVLLSVKFFLPVGPIEPYGEIGVGAYFSKLETESGLGTEAFREVDYGPHAGVGINIDVSDTTYLGVEGRYRKVKPEFGDQEVRIDGYTATVNLGFRY